MIENIKRFVNEHHTLMVVVIGVLVICFIYWWFYCKEGAGSSKTKGGTIDYISTKCNLNIFESNMDLYFQVLGAHISSSIIDDDGGKEKVCGLLYVLNERGVEHICQFR